MTRAPPSGERLSAEARSSGERELLIALSASVQRYAIYPRGHPMLQGVAAQLHAAVSALSADTGVLPIRVARDHIHVGDLTIPGDAPLLRDLSRRLLAHQVGAVTFHDGVSPAEVDRLLAALAAEAVAEPLSLPGVVGVRIRPLDYGRIGLGTESPTGEVQSPGELWDALARAALIEPREDPREASDVAESIMSHGRESAFLTVVAAHLLRVVDALQRGADDADSTRTRLRVAELIRRLDADTLRAIVRLDDHARRRADLLRAAATAVPPDALVRLLTAAAETAVSSVSRGLLRILAKLSAFTADAPADARPVARAELRRAMDRLLADWTLEDPNPEQYGRILDTVAFGRMASATGRKTRPVGLERVLEISQEVGAWGPAVERVAQTLLDRGDVRQLLQTIRSEEGDPDVRRELATVVLTPRLIYLMTADDEVDRDGLLDVSRLMGEDAVEPLLDALADSPSRNVRRCAFDCLAKLGGSAPGRALRRVQDDRWFVTRNMLALVATAPVPESFDVRPYLAHADARVRVQAVTVARRMSDAASLLGEALSDVDARVVTTALRGLERVNAATVRRLRALAETDGADENRVLAVGALGRCPDPRARDALIAISGAGRNWLGRWRIRRRSPESVEALGALARNWAADETVRPILEAARKSRDADIQRAVERT